MAELSFNTIILWNIVVFLIYGIDKYKSVHNKWRISEKVLITCAVFLGGVGAYLGMQVFRHKTKKPLFKAVIPICVVLNLAVIYWLERG